jgi:hypothetical protein
MFLNKIHIKEKIKVIPFNDRKFPELIPGNEYFVSFGNNNVYPCKLLNLINEFEQPEVKIEIPLKSYNRKKFIDKDGISTDKAFSTHILYAKELGTTPVQAIQHTV